MSEALERQPHAILDLESRLLKAQKIARLVERIRPLRGARLLDIGAGSGHIASALGELVGLEHEEVTIPAMRPYNELERPSLSVRLLCAAPRPLLRSLLALNPTMIFLLRPAAL